MDCNTNLALSFPYTNYRVVAEFYRQSHIELLIPNLQYYSEHKKKDKWKKVEKAIKEVEKEIEQTVVKKIEQSPLPKKQGMINVSHTIGSHILKWIKHFEYFSLYNASTRSVSTLKNRITILKHLQWKDYGTVDEEKTAISLVNSKYLNIIERYRLACIYCFEDIIHILWKQLSNKGLHQKDLKAINKYEPHFVVFWTCYLLDKIVVLIPRLIQSDKQTSARYEYGFKNAVVQGNKVAVKCFWQKLTFEEKKNNIMKYAAVSAKKHNFVSTMVDDKPYFPKECYTDILCFLLFQMGDEERIEFLRNNAKQGSNVLRCFLDWSYQEHFLSTVKHMWGFLLEEEYSNLLLMIVDGIKDNLFGYQELFRGLWQKSPNEYRKFAINHWQGKEVLLRLLKIGDIKSVKLILDSIDALEKEKIIFFSKGEDICDELLYQGKWELLEIFTKQCIPNMDVAIKLKTKLQQHASHCLLEEQVKENSIIFYKFYQLLDNFCEEVGQKQQEQKTGIEDNEDQDM